MIVKAIYICKDVVSLILYYGKRNPSMPYYTWLGVTNEESCLYIHGLYSLTDLYCSLLFLKNGVHGPFLACQGKVISIMP